MSGHQIPAPAAGWDVLGAGDGAAAGRRLCPAQPRPLLGSLERPLLALPVLTPRQHARSPNRLSPGVLQTDRATHLVSSLADKIAKRHMSFCLVKTVDTILESQSYLWKSSLCDVILHRLAEHCG